MAGGHQGLGSGERRREVQEKLRQRLLSGSYGDKQHSSNRCDHSGVGLLTFTLVGAKVPNAESTPPISPSPCVYFRAQI